MRKRLRKVEKKVRREALTNVRLIQIEASYLVGYMLPPGAISAYYIFFPDPWPKRRHHRRRLFSPAFMNSLHGTLVEGGRVHIATDHLDYFAEIHGLMNADTRFEEIAAFVPEEEEQTNFELIFLGQQKEIGRCSFSRKHNV